MMIMVVIVLFVVFRWVSVPSGANSRSSFQVCILRMTMMSLIRMKMTMMMRRRRRVILFQDALFNADCPQRGANNHV